MIDIAATLLPEVLLFTPRVHRDERGFLFESWHERHFAEAGLHARFVQDLHSGSRLHALRGLHYQIEQTQGKLVCVTQGEAFDVAVDIRKSSPRFGQWVGVRLSSTHPQLLWVPPGFAHGYLALSEHVDFLYKCTDFYAPQHERSIRWDDPDLNIAWPLPNGIPPNLSPKDAVALRFAEAEYFP